MLAIKDVFPSEMLMSLSGGDSALYIIFAPIFVAALVMLAGLVLRSLKRIEDWRDIEPYMRLEEAPATTYSHQMPIDRF